MKEAAALMESAVMKPLWFRHNEGAGDSFFSRPFPSLFQVPLGALALAAALWVTAWARPATIMMMAERSER